MPDTFERHVGRPLADFLALNHEQRSAATRQTVTDLHRFFPSGGLSPLERDAPPRTRNLASGLFDAVSLVGPAGGPAHAAPLADRIITDALLRSEADRDQNVYLPPLFTRTLTNAVPDVIFQPVSLAEVSAAFRWARPGGVPITLRGAGSTAMGGSVPNDGGVTLDLSRLDAIDVEAEARSVVVGAGARLRDIHERLAARGLALRAYPSNLGGTLAGWFVSGGIGLNAFRHGRALESVLSVDVVLPAGEHVRFHADGRIDAPGGDSSHRTTISSTGAAEWFNERGYRLITLADLAASEGVFGVVLQLTMSVEPLAEIGAFLLEFPSRDAALAAATWTARQAGVEFPPPSNLKLFTASHFHHVERVWRDEDARDGHATPGGLSGRGLPWRRIAGPAELGLSPKSTGEQAMLLFVDFHGLEDAREFATVLGESHLTPGVLGEPSVRFAAERFRPQQTKRLGPGLLAAEVVLPAIHLSSFLAAAEQLAAGAGVTLDSEVYFVKGGDALVIAGYLTDHRRASFAVDLTLAPAIVDLAMRRFGGRPYVLGRWQAGFFARGTTARAAELRAARAALDPQAFLNRGVYTEQRLHGWLGTAFMRTFVPGISLLRGLYGSPATSWLARIARAGLSLLPGPAFGRGEQAAVGARFVAPPPPEATPAPNGAADAEPRSILLAIAPVVPRAAAGGPAQAASARAIHCVNCGECNSVCPIFHESKIRLPQMLTHLGESVHAGHAVPESGAVLLDLCMRCGNCEEVCQAGIPHLALYDTMQRAADAARPRDVERHTAIVAAVRGSQHYRKDFLDLRGGMYLRRQPAALPGLTRFLVMRSENDAGPESTCIHCGACVPVCPTNANREYEASDPRLVTTVQSRCIGCGSCVEVCPANGLNGGRTLRVMEAPATEWFTALEEFERLERAPAQESAT